MNSGNTGRNRIGNIGRCTDEVGARFVFTGGPGFGKTAVLEALARQGFQVLPEAPRQIIIEQRERNPAILPETDFQGFAALVAERMIRQYRQGSENPVLLDRGLPDIPVYLQNAGLSVTPDLDEVVAGHPYDPPVFFFPDWEDLFCQDGVRYESYEEACRIGEALRQYYGKLGYEVIEIPRCRVEQRAQFILGYLNMFF